MTDPTGSADDRPVRGAIAVVVLGLSVVAGASAITLLSLIMRSVTAIGGSCADGGPYVSTQPCPSGTGTALLLVFVCVGFSIIAGLWAASVLKAPLAVWLGWPALFLTLGWNFLEYGFDPPMGESIAGGFVVCGVVFVLMGVAPLLMWAAVGKENRRSRRAGARVPAPVPTPAMAAPAPAVATRQPAERVEIPGQRLEDEPATLREERKR